MKRQKISVILGVICLVFIMAALPFMAACAPEAPPPEKPTPHEPFAIKISSLFPGTQAYILGIGLAEMINKNSTWLTATAPEGPGPIADIKILITEPERRKDTLFFTSLPTNWYATLGIGPFAESPFNTYDYSEFKHVCLLGFGADGLVVRDPNIKTLQDLRGKTVVMDTTPGKERGAAFLGIFKAAGVSEDEMRVEYLKSGEACNALRDGMADACHVTVTLSELPDTYVPSPALMELMAQRDIYFLSFDETDIQAMKAEIGNPRDALAVPPRQMSSLQTELWTILSNPLTYCAHVDMPDYVVAEVLRIIYENIEVLHEYTPMAKILTQDTMATMGAVEDDIHPGAVKFYKEKGIPITSFGK